MPLRIITAPAGSGLSTHLRSLRGRYLALPSPEPASWWRLAHALGAKGGALRPAINTAMSAFRGALVLDLPFPADDFTKLVLADLGTHHALVVVGIEAGVPGTQLPPTDDLFDVLPEAKALAGRCRVCLRIARNRQPRFLATVRVFLDSGNTPLQAFLHAALTVTDEIVKTQYLLLGGLVEPGVEATIDKATLAMLWGISIAETTDAIETMHTAGLLSRTNKAIHLHKLVTAAIHRKPAKEVRALLADPTDTPFLKSARVRLELAAGNRRDAINTALTYRRTRGRCMNASADVARVLEEWHFYEPLDRQEFCVCSAEVEEGLRLLASALFEAGVYAAGDVVEEAYQIYGRLFVWRGRNTVVRRFLIGLELFGGAVRRGEKGEGRRVG